MNITETRPPAKPSHPTSRPTTHSWFNQGIETMVILAIIVTPLLFSPLSRELFEFPKMVWIYFLAIAGLTLISLKAVTQSRLEIPHHPLSRPLIIYGLIVIIATILSLDIYTSIMGYYSRFHGGLASLAAYLVLFYLTLIYLQPADSRPQRTAKLLWSWVASSIIISAWAVAEHAGYSPSCWLLRGELNADCWVQDVQARVFATFGQPNWLAAYLITSIPLSLALLIQSTQPRLRFLAWLGASLGYAAFWYTYSRSGWIGLAMAGIIILPWLWRINYRQLWPWLGSLVVVWGLVSSSSIQMASQRTATALESGNLDSSTGQIRLLVWQGSLQTVLEYPLFGSGPETFPYSFLRHRPTQLNQTTEWNFLYNKAHNEALQVTATTGILGLVAWLAVYFQLTRIAWRQKIIALHPQKLGPHSLVSASLFAGIAGVFTAQLLGFSVVVTSVYFWLAAAILIAPLTTYRQYQLKVRWRPFTIIVSIVILSTLLLGLASYYVAEVVANQASSHLRRNPWQSEQQLLLATRLNPFESSYQQQLALASAYIAQVSSNSDLPSHYASLAQHQAQQAYQRNPYHILNLKGITTVYWQLSQINQSYLGEAIKSAQKAIQLDSTDANARQTLAQLYLQAKQYHRALDSFNQLVRLRPQAASPYLQRAQYYQQVNQPSLALQDVTLAQTLEPSNPEVIDALQQLTTQYPSLTQ